jgi:hypothetical protein
MAKCPANRLGVDRQLTVRRRQKGVGLVKGDDSLQILGVDPLEQPPPHVFRFGRPFVILTVGHCHSSTTARPVRNPTLVSHWRAATRTPSDVPGPFPRCPPARHSKSERGIGSRNPVVPRGAKSR